MMKNCKETLLDKGRKLFSLMLCALTVSACNDDDCINGGTDNNNLQVEVSTSMHSRASIHNTALPDNNPIGVTLTATDGSSYDKQNYTNIPYYGTTADGKQTWQPQDKPVTLSVTEGVAMAYWPYNQNAADMTAVPVETDSQTDYMYSGNVTGLSNTAPKAAFQMKHAMALVRVNVVRGTYTAAGTVTAVTAASEAFCTSGTMNVSTGALADLVGAETPFIEEPSDAVITTSGRMTEFLVLPDVDVDAASVTLGVTVDGRKYSTTIEVTETFKQGYIYTYNLTLDNTALNVSAVAVAPWKEEISVEAPKPVAEDDQYIVEVTIDSDNYNYTHNIGGFVGTIDWGDGTTTIYDLKTSYPSHTYATAGKYLVVCSGKASNIKSYDWRSIQIYGGTSTRDISKLIHIGGDMGIMSMEMCFQNQTKLTEIPAGIFDGLDEVTSFWWGFGGCINITGGIPEGLFDKCVKVESFSRMFESCKGLTGPIPEGLFDNCTEVTNFSATFAGCTGITSIPDGLFDNCTKATTFSSTFINCSGVAGIPEGLFDNCRKVTNFSEVFRNCNNLNSIPDGLFDNCPLVMDFSSAFYNCNSLTGNLSADLFKCNTEVTTFNSAFLGCSKLTGSIPSGLFDNCSKVKDFKNTFNGCSGLTGTIPAGLFDKCTEVTNFDNVFRNCKGLTGSIPAGLFDNNKKAVTFNYTFSECTSISAIPDGLFDNNSLATDFCGTFNFCQAITEIPNGLFNNNPLAYNFSEVFARCIKLEFIPAGLFDKNKGKLFWGAFMGCTSLIEIPEGLFDNCTEVTDFSNTFAGCSNLTGNIPTGLFDKCTKVTNFESTFYGCKGLTGPIPAGLFDNCPEVTTFTKLFEGCRGLTGEIPQGLFDNNAKVTKFERTFYGCTALTGESPYTIINVNGNDVKVHLYERANYPEHFTVSTSYKLCFHNCSKLIDWAEITAAGWN